MRINKQAVLDKIDAYYRTVASAEHEQQLRRQERWDTWHAEQLKKSPDLAAALRAAADRVDAGDIVTKYRVSDDIDKLAHDRNVPYNERRSDNPTGWSEFPRKRPEVDPLETILAKHRAGGRFTDLIGVLTNMVGDDVAVSSLQKLGVLDTQDARLIFAAHKAAA